MFGWTPLSGEELSNTGKQTEKSSTKNTSEKKNTSEIEFAEYPLDVTPMFNVTFTDKIKKTTIKGESRFAFTVPVTMHNVSYDNIPGPVRLVVIKTGIKGLRIINEDGRLNETNEEYTEFTPHGKSFHKGYKSTVKMLTFVSKTEIKPEEIDTDRFTYKVTREEGMSLEEIKKANGDKLTDEDKMWDQKNYSRAELANAMSIQEQFNERMLSKDFELKDKLISELYGTAVGEDKDGQPAMVVFASRIGYQNLLPKQIDGINVLVNTTLPFHAGPAGADNHAKNTLVPESDNSLTPNAVTSSNPKARQVRPVPIGSSIANASESCYSGTLGFRGTSLVDGKKVIVTNNHVIGEENGAKAGERVSQPSTGDIVPACTRPTSDEIGQFRSLIPIEFTETARNVVDTAMANTTAALTSASSPENIAYGMPDSVAINPVIGMNVMKYGRTSGFTRGKITSVNASTFVGYDAGDARFVSQVVIGPYGTSGTSLGKPGDSGSLIISESSKQPVALLFAGGGTRTVGNPIKSVLTLLKVSIDGGASAETPTTPTNKGTVGDFVFLDANMDGIQQSIELGLSGVQVILYKTGPDSKINTADDVLVKTTFTQSTGKYSFTNIDSGEYYIKFVVPETHFITRQDIGSSDSVDSDANMQTGFTAAISVQDGTQNTDVDCGMIPKGSGRGRIGDLVWFDKNKNGRLDREESGVANVKINLLDFNGQVIKSTTTNKSGLYVFSDVPKGKYAVQFILPRGKQFTSSNAYHEYFDSDADTTTGISPFFDLGENRLDYSIDCGVF